MFIREDTGQIITEDVRNSVMKLTKILFRLNVIDDEQALNIATQFRILFV